MRSCFLFSQCQYSHSGRRWVQVEGADSTQDNGIIADSSMKPTPFAAQRRQRVLELHVAPEDVGKVIGKKGVHADAIRRLVHAIGGKKKRRYVLEIIE